MNFFSAGSINHLGGVIGSLVSGPVMVRLGQRVVVLMCLPISAVLWLIFSFSPSVWLLLTCRCFLGMLGGIIGPAGSIYILEIAHKSVRGRLFGAVIVALYAGSLFVGILKISGLDWRQMGFVFCTVLLIPFFGILFLPNSPRWLVTRGRVSDAQRSILYFRGEGCNPESELQEIIQQLDSTTAENNTSGQQLKLLLKRPTLHMFGLVTVLSILKSFSGFDAIFSYLANVFKATEFSLSPNISAIISASLTVVSGSFQLGLVDRIGRRALMIISFSVSSVCMLALGAYFYMVNNNIASNINWLRLGSVLIFVFFNCIGQSITLLLPGELLPTTCRSIGVALSVTEVKLVAFLSTVTYLYMIEGLGEHGTFWFYSGVSATAVVVSVVALPETRGRSLEEITIEQQTGTTDPEGDGLEGTLDSASTQQSTHTV